MKLRTVALFALLTAGVSSLALAQQAAGNASTTTKAPAGLSLAFDASRGQMMASGFTLKAAPMDSSVTPTTGAVEITVNTKLITKFKQGTRFKCGAMVLGGEIDTATYEIDGGLETAVSKASVNGNWAVCKLTIPYSWTLSGASVPATGLIVGFAVAAVDFDGDTVRSTVQVSGVDNLPASGVTTKYAFSAAL